VLTNSIIVTYLHRNTKSLGPIPDY
jgi:hypothetical protein